MEKYYVGYKWKDDWVIVESSRGCPFFFLRGCPPLHWLRRVESGGYEPIGREVTRKIMAGRNRRYVYNKFWLETYMGERFNIGLFFSNSYEMFRVEHSNLYKVLERQFFDNRRY